MACHGTTDHRAPCGAKRYRLDEYATYPGAERPFMAGQRGHLPLHVNACPVHSYHRESRTCGKCREVPTLGGLPGSIGAFRIEEGS